MTLYRVVSSFVVSASLLSAATLSRAQVMPDPKEIGGVPLPGTFVFDAGGMTCVVPIVASIVLSIVVTLVLNVILRMMNK